MKEIILTQGQVALVDDEDFEYLNQWKWHAQRITSSDHLWYAKTVMDGCPVMMHRVLLLPSHGWSVDHIDGDGLNNRRANLRLATHQQNMMNSRRRTDRLK